MSRIAGCDKQVTFAQLNESQIADLRVLQDHCRALGTDLVIIGAIAYQVHYPREDRHTGDIDFAIALDLEEFAELEQRLLADKWIRFADHEHRWRSPRGTILDLLPETLHILSGRVVQGAGD